MLLWRALQKVRNSSFDIQCKFIYIHLGYPKSLWVHLQQPYLSLRELQFSRYTQGAATGANVSYFGLNRQFRQCFKLVYHSFRLRPRFEHRGRNYELAAIELGFATYVCQRHVLRPPFEQFFEFRDLMGSQLTFRISQKLGPIESGGVFQQNQYIQSGRPNSSLFQFLNTGPYKTLSSHIHSIRNNRPALTN